MSLFKRYLPHRLILVMKLTTFILAITLMQVSAASYAQRITLLERNTPISEILTKIQQQSGYDVFYKNKH